LVGSHPLGALAAFGLLRCCEELDGFRGARLGWRPPAWHAVLEAEAEGGVDGLIGALAARQPERPGAPELNWASTLKVPRDTYLGALRGVGEGQRCFADFLAAFACELWAGDDGLLEPTAFYMTSGRQEFLKEARTLATRLATGVSIGRRRKGTDELFREALLGPWRYEDAQHSLGWDPSAERLHALRARSPTREPSEGVTAAVWLAFEALPLFPCFLSEGRRMTTGFHRHGPGRRGRATFLTWPVWESPVPLDTVRSLLAMPELAEEQPPAKELRARGVGEVFRSQRYKVKTQGAYYILRPAFLCL
jgi:hypothetical protein